MIKKIIFYLLLFLILIFLQLYAIPFFFIYALFILFWVSLETKEIYIFLIGALVLDILSSFIFGFWFILAILIFISTRWVLKSFLKKWTTFTFIIVFMFWQLIYGFSYLILSGQKITWLISLDFVWSLIVGLLIFVLLDFSRNWLEKEELITISKPTEINI